MNYRKRVLAATLLMAFPFAARAQTNAAQTPAVEPTASEVARYPRRFEGGLGTVVVHTPQIDSWDEFRRVEARSVVEVTPSDESEPAYGVIEFAANTDTNLERHLVSIEDIEIVAASFQDAGDARQATLESVVRDTLPSRNKLVPLDVVLSYVALDAQAPGAEGLSADPPPIFYSDSPAYLVMTDGEPLLAPIDDTRLKYVINTNWDLFRYKDRQWYLRQDTRWLSSKSEGLDGQWKYTKSLPKDFKKLPDDGNFEVVKAAMPPDKTKDPVPTLFISDRPAELILLDGGAVRSTIGADGLIYVSNTESDLFVWEGEYYYLVSGRWFKAGKLRGPWTFVEQLPAVFASIPADHDKAHVRAAVAGTTEARMATLEAMLPRKATIRRDAGDNVIVVFQGEPQFEPIEGTTALRAVNTPDDIVQVGDTYYLCAEAVWYYGSSPQGPWTVADTIPAEIYRIPASSPAYHVTHVQVYESDSNSVSTGYTSGYFGTHVSFGVVVYGSGYYYPPYHYYNPYYYGYPIYYPYPYSYGSSSWYNPNTGMYGRANSVYGPYGGYGRGASYNPKTGTYARGAAVWDSNEMALSAAAYNPRTGTGVATNRYVSEDGGWGESLITRDDKWVKTESNWDGDSRTTRFEGSQGGTGQVDRTRNANGSVTGEGQFQRGDQSLQTRSVRNDQGGAVGFETGDGRTGAVGRSTDGDLYAGSDGQVYKRDENGWQQRDGDNWNPVEVPDERAAQMDQTRSQVTEKRAEFQESGNFENASQRRHEAGADRQRSREDFGTRAQSRPNNRSSYNSGMQRELNRSHGARTRGYDRYDNRASRGSMQRSRPMPRGGRRR